MRIIAGRHKRRLIRAPAGRATRPMLDRVREAMFATLMPWIPNARVLDLFAGSGSLGLEALSRGAHAARLVEKHPATVQLLRTNVASLGLAGSCEILRGDALAPESWQGGPLFAHQARYDLVFLDPPYALLEDPRARRTVLDVLTTLVRTHLANPGYLVLHAPRGLLGTGDFDPRPDAAVRQYGSTALWYVTHADTEVVG